MLSRLRDLARTKSIMIPTMLASVSITRTFGSLKFLDGDNNPSRGIALSGAEPTDIFKVVLSKTREISQGESRSDERSADVCAALVLRIL